MMEKNEIEEKNYYTLNNSIIKLSRLIDEWENCPTDSCNNAFDTLEVRNLIGLRESDSAQKRLEQLTGPYGRILYAACKARKEK